MASFYQRRRRSNAVWTALSYAATAFGLCWLVFILGALVWNGIGGLSLDIFTKMTPAPGVAGGLLNAIVGSLITTGIGVVIGAPLGILAGTYMAEYGQHSRVTSIVRFINDILLSAPSIIVGLFIYQLLVVPFHHFSGWAGGVALAVIALPVVVRTTEDMLNLVPNTLREAASALGMPRSLVIQRVAYRSVRAGLVTGVLLAVARIQRRDRAAGVHCARQQPVRMEPRRADGEPAADHLRICPQSLSRPAEFRSPGPARCSSLSPCSA